MSKRKKAAILKKIKTALIIFTIIYCIAYVSNSDYETLKMECKSGLRVCNVDANQ